MNQRFKWLRRAGAGLTALLLAAAAGCGARVVPPTGTTPTTQASVTTAPPAQVTTVAPQADDEIVSGTLRLSMLSPDTYNPLTSETRSYRQQISLMYDALFEPDGYGSLKPVLAAEVGTWDTAHQVYTVKIRPDLSFSNGSKLLAQDVVDCLHLAMDTWSSPYYSDTTVISGVEAPDDVTVRFTLSAYDAFFAYRLQMPICKLSEEINGLLPGTGRYFPTAVEGDGSLTLAVNPHHATDPASKIRRVQLTVYPDERAIYEAFANDELDLVPVAGVYYSEMERRQNLTLKSFDGLDYYLISYNLGTTESPIETEADLEQIKQILTRSRLLAPQALSRMISPYRYPVTPILSGGQEGSAGSAVPAGSDWPEDRRPLRVIFNEDNELARLLGVRATELLHAGGVQAEAVFMSPEHYAENMDEGTYDLSVVHVRLDHNPDPGWIYSRSTQHQIAGSGWIRQTAFEPYASAVESLRGFEAEPDLLPMDSESFGHLLDTLDRNAPFTGIGFQYEGVLIGPRVRGNYSANTLDLYESLEDVWIWSGS